MNSALDSRDVFKGLKVKKLFKMFSFFNYFKALFRSSIIHAQDIPAEGREVKGAHRKILAVMNSVFAVRRDLNKTLVG